MRFWICCGYYASIGLLFFIIGRILPKKWFDYNAFPYKAFDCEKDGKIYEKIAISKWQSKVPDMSRIFPMLMPKKRMVATDPDTLLLMVRETCIAELIHVLLSICGLFGIYIMPGVWGVLFYAGLFSPWQSCHLYLYSATTWPRPGPDIRKEKEYGEIE